MADFDQSEVFGRNQTQTPIQANEYTALVGYFTKRNFDRSSAEEISSILIAQAQSQDIPTFQLIDTLKGLTDVQLSEVITQVLNLNRPKSSTIGFVSNTKPNAFEARNIEGLGG